MMYLSSRPLPSSLAIWALATLGVCASAAASPALTEIDICAEWDKPSIIQHELDVSRDLDQLIAGDGGPHGYDLDALARLTPPECRLSDQTWEVHPKDAALAELRCRHFHVRLRKIGPCYAQAGIAPGIAAPAQWDTRSWDGAEDWNHKFSAQSESDRCVTLQKALSLAIAEFAIEPATLEVEGLARFKDDPHALIIGTQPKPGHVRDRARAAWILRRLHFTQAELVPAACAWIKQEGELRWIEALNLWHETYPQIFGKVQEPKRFGRQPLGYAMGMCARSNNAHFVDRLDDILAHNRKLSANGGEGEAIPIAHELQVFVGSLQRIGNDPGPLIRGAWNGEIDWKAFLGPLSSVPGRQPTSRTSRIPLGKDRKRKGPKKKPVLFEEVYTP